MRHSRALVWPLVLGAWAADGQPPVACGVKGTVLNAITGEPLAKAQVTLRSGSTDSSYSAAADEAGRFSLAGAEPGTYELLIQKRGFVRSGLSVSLKGAGGAGACNATTTGQTVADAVIRLMPQAVLAGRVVDGDGESIPGVIVEAIQSTRTGSTRRYSVTATATTNDLGEYRIYGLAPGRYYLGAAYRSETGYAAIYYPGSEEVTRSVPIDIRGGGEANGLNLTVTQLHSARIRGTIHGPAGLTVQGLMIVAAPCDAGPLNRSTTTVRGPDGAFSLRDLTPGCYVLAADSYVGGSRHSARLLISVGETNIEDAHLNLIPPVQLAGRIHAEDAAELKLRHVVVNIEARAAKLTAGGSPSDDGSFVLNNVAPEIYELSVAVPDGYYLKRARFGETDVLQSGLDLSRGASVPLDVEISGDGGSIDGSVKDGQDQPIADARVALIPEGASTGPARAKFTVADNEGRFQLRGIAPGDYRVHAAPDLDEAALQDPIYARQVEEQGQRVSIRQHGRELVVVKARESEASGR